jgi:triacylglycerol lipase
VTRVPRRPVVLAHGLAGFSQIGVQRLRLASYFKGIPEHLCALGCRVIAAEVPALGTVEARARALARLIRNASPDEPVHVIAHSMGGLDARHMISHLGMHERVTSLVTLGAPHRGSPVADRVSDYVRSSKLRDVLRLTHLENTALRDLRTDVCARWNERTPDAPGVKYFSIAGVKPREEMIYGLRFTHDVVAAAEGRNDGLVSESSAQWGETWKRWDCDHVNMIGWTGPRTRALGYARDVRPRFTRIVARLARTELQ